MPGTARRMAMADSLLVGHGTRICTPMTGSRAADLSSARSGSGSTLRTTCMAVASYMVAASTVAGLDSMATVAALVTAAAASASVAEQPLVVDFMVAAVGLAAVVVVTGNVL